MTFKSIADAQKAYFAAKDRKDAAGMKAANDWANDQRRKSGEALVDASDSIIGTAKNNPNQNKGFFNGGTPSRENLPYNPNNTPNISTKPGGVGAPDIIKYQNQTGGTSVEDKLSRLEQVYNNMVGGISQQPQRPQIPTYSQGNSLESYLRDQQRAATDAALARLQQAYLVGMQELDAAAGRIPINYAGAKDRIAAQNALERQAFAEQAAAAGLNSGTSGQGALAMSSLYQGALAGLEGDEAQAKTDIELEKARMKSEYEAAMNEARAKGDASLANALYEELVRQQEMARDDRAFEESHNRWAADNALRLQLSGIGTDGGTSTGTGSSAQSGAYAPSPSKPSSGKKPSGGGSKNTVHKDTSSSGAPSSRPSNEGLTDGQIKLMQEHFGVTADGIWGKNSTKAAGGLSAKEAWEKYIRETKPKPVNGGQGDVGMSANGKQMRNSMMREYEMNGNVFTTAMRDELARALKSGYVTDAEVNLILDALGQ